MKCARVLKLQLIRYGRLQTSLAFPAVAHTNNAAQMLPCSLTCSARLIAIARVTQPHLAKVSLELAPHNTSTFKVRIKPTMAWYSTWIPSLLTLQALRLTTRPSSLSNTAMALQLNASVGLDGGHIFSITEAQYLAPLSKSVGEDP